jgi:hypothetical protein
MASLGELTIDLEARTEMFMAPVAEAISKTTSLGQVMDWASNRVIAAGASMAVAGLAMEKFTPAFADVGRLTKWFGVLTTGVGSIGRMVTGLTHWAKVATQLNTAVGAMGGLMPFLSGGITMVAGSVGALMTALLPILPILLAVGVAVFALYTIWTENLFGIQDAAFSILGTIGDVFTGVFNTLKGIVTGFFEGTAPFWKLLGTTIKLLLLPLTMWGKLFRSTSDGGFSLGKTIGWLLTFAMFPLKMVLIALTPIINLISRAVDWLSSSFDRQKEAQDKAWGAMLRGEGIMGKIFMAIKPVVDMVSKFIEKIQELYDWWNNLGNAVENNSDTIAGSLEEAVPDTGALGTVGGSYGISQTGAATYSPTTSAPGTFEKTMESTRTAPVSSKQNNLDTSVSLNVGTIASNMDVENIGKLLAKHVNNELGRMA